MKIGMTYDLRSDYLKMGYSEEETAEFDRDETIDSIEAAIKAAGYATDRIGNINSLAARLVTGDTWDLVFNIAEGMRGIAREAQVPALLEAYNVPYTFSNPLVLAVTLHKGMTKELVRAAGVPTADFCVVGTESAIGNISLPFPLFVKPVAEGTSKGITARSMVTSAAELRAVCRELLHQFHQPVIVEKYLPGREFTVGIIGSGDEAYAIGALEVLPKKNAEAHSITYWNKENCEEVVDYAISSDRSGLQAQEISLQAWRALGCVDAGRVDVREDEQGNAQFIEVNPLAGLHPTHSDLPILCTLAGIRHTELIARIISCALNRYKSVLKK